MIDLHHRDERSTVPTAQTFAYSDLRPSGIVDSHHMLEKFRSVTIAILNLARMKLLSRQTRAMDYPIVMSDEEIGMDHFMLEDNIQTRTESDEK